MTPANPVVPLVPDVPLVPEVPLVPLVPEVPDVPDHPHFVSHGLSYREWCAKPISLLDRAGSRGNFMWLSLTQL
jgi:hypothetical protein